MAIVLVIGGSGFLGAHLIVRLLADGHEVRTTVRTVDRRDDVERMVLPVLGPDLSTSVQMIQRVLTGGMPVLPPLWSNTVDVRDVADLEVRVMTAPGAAGQRYLAVAGEPISFATIAKVLREKLGPDAAKVPRFTLPGWAVRLLAPFNPQLRAVASQFGVVRRVSNAKARALGWAPRPNEESVVSTAQCLVALG